jgi:hypothetical protein
MRVIMAKAPGKCCYCILRIEKGDLVVVLSLPDGFARAHEECAMLKDEGLIYDVQA